MLRGTNLLGTLPCGRAGICRLGSGDLRMLERGRSTNHDQCGEFEEVGVSNIASITIDFLLYLPVTY